jgi:MoxR-like ATPase
VFHFIEFPDRELMARIVRVHHPKLESDLLERTLKAFYELRDEHGLRKRPSTSELIDWIAALKRAGLATKDLDESLPFLGVLLKREQDLLAVAERQARGRGRG